MRQERLSKLLDISIGRTPPRNEPSYWGKGHRWVSIRDLNSKVVTETKEQITDRAVTGARCKIVKKGTLLFSFKLTIGKMAFAGCDLFTNEAIAAFAIKDEKELHPEFLYYALQSATYGGSNQAVMGKTLNSKSLAEIEIPFPLFDDQIRIAHLLGKVEGLIAQRKQHLQQLDDLLKSVFLEMFGPGSPGYENWPLVEIRELAAKHKGAMRTGPFGSNLLHSEFSTDGDVAVLGIDNAVNNYFAWGERRFISNEKYQDLQSYRVFPGDVIVTIMGTIGRSAVIPDDIPIAVNTKHLAAITLNREIANPVFLSYSIHSSPFVLNQFESKNRGAIMRGLNLSLIKETKIKRPPIELQNRFAKIHERVNQLKLRYQQSLADLEALYGALSQHAFKGELDLSRVPFPASQMDRGDLNTKVELQPEFAANRPLSLPELPTTISLSNASGRKDALRFWIEAYLAMLSPGGMFDAAKLLDAINFRLIVMDDADHDLALDDYDFLKLWILDALRDSRLEQTRNVTGHDDKGRPIFGNLIELRIAQT